MQRKQITKLSVQLQNEFGLSSHECLNYHKIIASIPKTWLFKLNAQPNQNGTEHISLYKTLTEKELSNICRYMTDFQVKHFTYTEKPKSHAKWELNFPGITLQWKAIYTNVFDSCKDNKLQNFQYNFIHRNIATNKYLLKCSLEASSLCTFCNMAVESIDHLFWECHLIQLFWNNVFDVLAEYNLSVVRSKIEVFLYTKDHILSYIYMYAKFYIYQCKFKNVLPNIELFKTKLCNRINLEKQIAINNDKLQQFNSIWSKLQGFFEA